MDEFGLPLTYPYHGWNGQQLHEYNPSDNRWQAGADPYAQATPTPDLPPRHPFPLDYSNFNNIFDGPDFAASFGGLQTFSQYGLYSHPMPSTPQASGININPGLPSRMQLSPSNFLFATHLSTYNNLHAQVSSGLPVPQPGNSGFQPAQQYPSYSSHSRPYNRDNFRVQEPELPVPDHSLHAPDRSRVGTPALDRQAQPHNNNNYHINNFNFPPAPRPAEPTSDDFLQALADGDFSSPSSIPSRGPLASPHLAVTEGVQPAPRRTTSFYNSLREEPSSPDISNNHFDNDNMPPAKRTAPTRRSARTRATPETVVLDSSSPPAASKRPTISLKRPVAPSTSKPRAAPNLIQKRGIKRQRSDDYDPFRSDDNDELVGLEVVDLVGGEKKVEAEAPKKNMVRLAKYNCVICMDDCAGLTVTQCGHLFCAECLHSALNIDRSKTICPICRQKLDLKPGTKKKVKPFVHLELKLMSKTRAGKRPAKV